MSAIRAEQVLHGYTRGHGLVAASDGVNAEERALLDRLSDLSGYLPVGLRYDRYHTGFPCGRYYAVACTWPDATAPRGGAVVTHSLLLPRDSLGQPRILERAWNATRRPSTLSDKGFDVPVILPDPVGVLTAPAWTPERARSAIALLFGSTLRPILWVEETRPDDVVRGLWDLLWGEARSEFSFCTLALAPRQVDGRVFTFLGVPPAARGSFSSLGTSAAWWDPRRPREPRIASNLAEPWVQRLLDGGPALVEVVVERARSAGVSIRPEEFPAHLRLDDLSRSAVQRLTAARAYADLLATHLPGLAATHPWWQQALGWLMDRQQDAALSPKPFWDLVDLLSRQQTVANAAEPLFLARVEHVLFAEVVHRLREACSEALAGLPDLANACLSFPGLSAPLVNALGRAVCEAAEADDLDRAIELATVVTSRLDLATAALAVLLPLPEDARHRAAVGVLNAGAGSEARDRLMAVAERAGDLWLAYLIGEHEAGPPSGLQRAAALAVAVDGPGLLGLRRLLERLPPEAVLSWSLSVSDPTLVELARTTGASAARGLGLGLDEAVTRCLDQPGGPAMFHELARSAPREKLWTAAAQHPAFTALVLEQASHRGGGEYTRTLARGLPRLLTGGTLRGADAGLWLQNQELREGLGRASRWDMFPTSGRPGPRLLAPLVEAVQALPGEVSIHLLVELLCLALQDADRDCLHQGTEGLVDLLGRPLDRDDRTLLQGEALGAVDRLRPPGGYLLVRPCFPGVYPAVRDGQRFPLNMLSWWYDSDWDRAKRWRHWLVDAWIDERWPAVELIRVIDATAGAEKLFNQVANRAWKSRAGEDLMRQASKELDSSPELERWRRPLERLFREGPPWVEYP